MTATYTEPVLNYTIPLDFRHRLSTVEVRIERNEGVREAAIENVKRTSRFNLLTGEVVTDESRGNCRMYRYSQQGDATTVFRVTVPAQTLTTSSNYVTLTGDTDIKLRGTSDMVTYAGQIHNYSIAVSYTHLRAHETGRNLVCRLLLEKKKKNNQKKIRMMKTLE